MLASESFEDSPTYAHYERLNAQENEPTDISLRLVGKSPLWGHLLWNAGRVAAECLDERRDKLVGKSVLELGAAAALPSLLASLSAANVVATDYPDQDLIANIQHNIDWLQAQMKRQLPISCQGYIWGEDPSALIGANGGRGFDLVIMSDLVFHHEQHQKLVDTCAKVLGPNGVVFVVFTPHRPSAIKNDMAFFELAEKCGFSVEKVLERRLAPMFKDDTGCPELRSTVFGYVLKMGDAWF